MRASAVDIELRASAPTTQLALQADTREPTVVNKQERAFGARRRETEAMGAIDSAALRASAEERIRGSVLDSSTPEPEEWRPSIGRPGWAAVVCPGRSDGGMEWLRTQIRECQAPTTVSLGVYLATECCACK